MPCDLVDASYMFRKGTPLDISKYRLYEKNTIDSAMGKNSTAIQQAGEKFTDRRPVDLVIKALEEKEGCKFHGTVDLHIMSTTIQIRLSNPYLTEQIRQHYRSLNRSDDFV